MFSMAWNQCISHSGSAVCVYEQCLRSHVWYPEYRYLPFKSQIWPTLSGKISLGHLKYVLLLCVSEHCAFALLVFLSLLYLFDCYHSMLWIMQKWQVSCLLCSTFFPLCLTYWLEYSELMVHTMEMNVTDYNWMEFVDMEAKAE